VAKFLGVHNQQSGSHAPQSVCPALDRLRYLFTNDIVRLLVGSQPQEDWLTKLVVVGPLGKFHTRPIEILVKAQKKVVGMVL